MRFKKGIGAIGNMLIALMIFSSAILGISVFVGSGINSYNLTSTANETLSTFSKMSELENETLGYKRDIEGGEISILEAFELFLTGAFRALLGAFRIPDIVASITYDLAGTEGIHLPVWFIALISGIIMVIIIFTIISAGFKHQV